jgi:hypothetical protein
MSKCSLYGAVALLMLAGCSKEPEHTYSAPLIQPELEKQALILGHRAEPVQLPGYEHVYVAEANPARKDCARCHKPGEEPYRDESMPPGQDAHWEIAVHHAGDMDCFSCHKKEDPAKLVSVVNKAADLGSAYLHCGSCHKDQFESWLGGAHGKRLTGWSGVRIIKNCTGCHDPHAPARGTTLPVAQPTVTPERAKGH